MRNLNLLLKWSFLVRLFYYRNKAQLASIFQGNSPAHSTMTIKTHSAHACTSLSDFSLMSANFLEFFRRRHSLARAIFSRSENYRSRGRFLVAREILGRAGDFVCVRARLHQNPPLYLSKKVSFK